MNNEKLFGAIPILLASITFVAFCSPLLPWYNSFLLFGRHGKRQTRLPDNVEQPRSK